MAKWEASDTLTREQSCTMCGTRYRYNFVVTASSSVSALEAEHELQKRINHEIERDASAEPVKCPGCNKMTPQMWAEARLSALMMLLFVGGGIGIGVLICWVLLRMLEETGLFAWGALLFVGFWTVIAIVGLPFLVLQPLLQPTKGVRVDAPAPLNSGQQD